MPRHSRPWSFGLVTAGITAALIVLVGELFVRALGFAPWQTLDDALEAADEPVIHAPDAEIGWVNKPGEYRMPAYGPAGRRASGIPTTIWPNGARATAQVQTGRSRQVVLCGGSFTQGFSIADDETFAYRLQNRLSEVEIVNLGTAGYGTYQCLLLLRRYLAAASAPDVVAYGFYDHHEGRNVAAAHWLRSMALTSRRGLVNLPFCEMEDDGLRCGQQATGYPSWPFREYSALATFLQDRWAESGASARYARRGEVTHQVVRELRDLAASQGSAFLTVVLHAEPFSQEGWLKSWRLDGEPFVDCTHRGFARPAWSVPVDGHPNGRLNAAWADCIEGPLRGLLESE